MSLIRATFTGCDNSTNIQELIELQRQYPFIEWGILLKKGVGIEGNERFPGIHWCAEFNLALGENKITQAAKHICGKELLNRFMFETNYRGFFTTYLNQRIQLNLPAGLFKSEDINNAIKAVKPINVITQHNKSKENLWKEIDAENHHILFDASGGKGKETINWPKYLSGKFCSYAGGLGPDNLEKQLILIDQASGGKDYGIDMEGNIRTNGKFDLNKVKRCIEIVSNFKK